MRVRSQVIYKSYKSREVSNGLGAGGPPSGLVFRVEMHTTGKLKGQEKQCKVEFMSGWFSESRGYGGVSKTKSLIVTIESIKLLVREVIRTGDTTAVCAFVDNVQEEANEEFLAVVKEWWEYASAENAEVLRDQKRREYAFASKVFQIGDVVGRSYEYNHLYTISGERFEWNSYHGGGWRYSFPGYSGYREHFWIPTEEQKATLPVIKFDEQNRRIG